MGLVIHFGRVATEVCTQRRRILDETNDRPEDGRRQTLKPVKSVLGPSSSLANSRPHICHRKHAGGVGCTGRSAPGTTGGLRSTPAALLSVLSELVLGRPRLIVTPQMGIEIRNPIRRVRVPVDAVTDVRVGALGIPYLLVGDTKIRIGLEQTLIDTMNSGSESLASIFRDAAV